MNERELDVLSILAKSEIPMMATDVVESKRGLTQSTVTAVLRKMLNDGLVEVVGVTHSGKVLSRTYRVTDKAKDAVLEHLKKQFELSRGIVSKREVMAVLKEED